MWRAETLSELLTGTATSRAAEALLLKKMNDLVIANPDYASYILPVSYEHVAVLK